MRNDLARSGDHFLPDLIPQTSKCNICMYSKQLTLLIAILIYKVGTPSEF